MKKRHIKAFACFMGVALAFSLTGCGKDKEEDKSSTTEVVTEAVTEEITTEEVTTEAAPKVDADGFTIVKQTVKTTDYINVRMSPSKDGDIYMELANDYELERVGYNDEWSKVVIDGTTCYVFSEYVTVVEDLSETGNSEESSTEESDADDSKESEETKSAVGELIVIDAGHQSTANTDTEPVGPGASETKEKSSAGNTGVSTGIAECELNLEIALQLEAELTSRGYVVKMVRTSNDVDMSNAARAEYANNLEAAAFIRIHTNGSTDSSASGCMTVCQTSANPYNSDIYSECKTLSTDVLNELSAATGAKSEGVWETDSMSGINWSKVPVTIVEVGYMTNPDEEAKLTTTDYQVKIAKGIANGIDKFLTGH
ncbi:MAG: N-acetylmuramoyl-L-alanine amidase [Coprococcus sp.]